MEKKYKIKKQTANLNSEHDLPTPESPTKTILNSISLLNF